MWPAAKCQAPGWSWNTWRPSGALESMRYTPRATSVSVPAEGSTSHSRAAMNGNWPVTLRLAITVGEPSSV